MVIYSVCFWNLRRCIAKCDSEQTFIANMDQRSQLHRYLYANRGCTTKARDEDFLSLDEKCGFASVQCSHDGCEVTVNKQDVASHEQSCEFRSVTCEECDEALKQKDYDRHRCVLERRVTELTKILQEFQGGQASSEVSLIYLLAMFCQLSKASRHLFFVL